MPIIPLLILAVAILVGVAVAASRSSRRSQLAVAAWNARAEAVRAERVSS